MGVLLEDEGESWTSATLLKVTVSQKKPLKRRRQNNSEDGEMGVGGGEGGGGRGVICYLLSFRLCDKRMLFFMVPAEVGCT